MARGRFISRSISLSDKFDQLIRQTGAEGALLITWLIPHLDCEGRHHGAPLRIRAAAMPYSDLNESQVATIIEAAAVARILVWYQDDNGNPCVWFPGFSKYQTGIRPERESPSDTAPWREDSTIITADRYQLRSYSGVTPQSIGATPPQVKLSQGKVSKVKSSEVKSTVVELHSQPDQSAIETTDAIKSPESLSESKALSVVKPIAETALARSGEASDGVLSVFAHYRTHHPNACKKPSATSKEWRAIKARLAEGYSVEDLCAAIDGCHLTPHNQGANDRGQKYLGLELIMRSASQVDRFAETARSHGATPDPQALLARLPRKDRESVAISEALQLTGGRMFERFFQDETEARRLTK